jgi:hypothetical protein
VDDEATPTGMCIVRVWRNGEGLLIRVVSVVDVASAGFGTGAATVRAEDAVDLVRDFLARCAARVEPPLP